ncbi:hypothetical protein [Streptomyces osmaniensis]|nr:hypothetical protein KJK32_46880 [Streptomyces sp. JCM17656]
MPRSRRLAPDVVRARLTVLADRLHKRDEDADFAEAVDAILAPRGWELLKPAAQSTGEPNLALWMNKSIKEAIYAKAQAAGENVRDVVEEGFRKFLAGEFTPEKPVRTVRGSQVEKDNLNVRASAALCGQVTKRCPAATKELGWEVTPGRVAMSWLYAEYGISDDDQRGVTVPDIDAD